MNTQEILKTKVGVPVTPEQMHKAIGTSQETNAIYFYEGKYYPVLEWEGVQKPKGKKRQAKLRALFLANIEEMAIIKDIEHNLNSLMDGTFEIKAEVRRK